MEGKEQTKIRVSRVMPVKIIREKKQISVRFPKEMVDKFNIDPEKDGFTWVVEEQENQISLKGVLIKNGREEAH